MTLLGRDWTTFLGRRFGVTIDMVLRHCGLMIMRYGQGAKKAFERIETALAWVELEDTKLITKVPGYVTNSN